MSESETNATWEREIIERGYSASMPHGWFDHHYIGGDMGAKNEDFEVTEIPAYLPCGSGEHIYLWIEKCGKTTLDVQKMLEKAYGVREAEVGYAGKKDVHAITRQWFSVSCVHPPENALDSLEAEEGIKVLMTTRHQNKLRMGHLKGNRFGVNLYGVTADDATIQACCDRLMQEGFINYFGLQRFGYDGGNISQGLRILQGGNARLQQKKMYISALQSAVFNLYAARRFSLVGFNVVAGDVMQKIGGGCFICEDPFVDGERARKGEVVVTGSLPGRKVKLGDGYTLELEQRCANDLGIDWPPHEDTTKDGESGKLLKLDVARNLAEGDRRPLWIRPAHVGFTRLSEPDALHLEFDLPSGCYATVLLRHLCGPAFTR